MTVRIFNVNVNVLMNLFSSDDDDERKIFAPASYATEMNFDGQHNIFIQV